MSSQDSAHYDKLAQQAQHLIDTQGATLEEAAAAAGCAVSTLQRHGVTGASRSDADAPTLADIGLAGSTLGNAEIVEAQDLAVQDPTLAPPRSGKRDLDMRHVNYTKAGRSEKLFAFLATCAAIQRVPFVAGPVGIGKTEIVRSLAKNPSRIGYAMPPGVTEMHFLDLNAAEMADEAAVSGMPVAFGSTENDMDGTVKHIARDVFQELTRDAEQELINNEKRSRGEPVPPEDEVVPTMLFIDEFTSASQDIQKPLLNMMSQRKTSFVTLPESCVLVAGGNLAKHSDHADELSAAMWNRFLVRNLEYPPATEWNNKWLKPHVEASDHSDERKQRTMHYGDVVEGFALHNPDFFDYMSSTTQEAVGTGPHASPRSIFAMVEALAVIDCSGIQNAEELHTELAQGAIGEGFGGAFVSYARELDLPDPEDWLADPTKAEVYSGRFDKTTVALRRLVAAIQRPAPPGTAAPENWRNERLLAAFEVLCNANENSKSMTRSGKGEFVSLCQNVATVIYNDQGLPFPTANKLGHFRKVGARMKKNFQASIGEMLELADDVKAAAKGRDGS